MFTLIRNSSHLIGLARPFGMNKHRAPRLGIDIGRVIIDGAANPGGGDTAFFNGDEATLLATPEVPDSVVCIERLTVLFDRQVWLVSKCGPRVQARTMRWLDAHRFFERTGIPSDNVRFCRERAEKRVHCLELGLTHFVDDHPDVHRAIRGATDHQYFFGPQRRPVPPNGTHCATWPDVESVIVKSLGTFVLSRS
jgi:tRNA(Leu) C34 or U34 (ribose-2'-O)-methylase TrmL